MADDIKDDEATKDTCHLIEQDGHDCETCDFPEAFRPVCKAMIELNDEISKVPHDERWEKFSERLQTVGMAWCSAVALCSDNLAEGAKRVCELYGVVTGVRIQIAQGIELPVRGKDIFGALSPEVKEKLVKAAAEVILGGLKPQVDPTGKVH